MKIVMFLAESLFVDLVRMFDLQVFVIDIVL